MSSTDSSSPGGKRKRQRDNNKHAQRVRWTFTARYKDYTQTELRELLTSMPAKMYVFQAEYGHEKDACGVAYHHWQGYFETQKPQGESLAWLKSNAFKQQVHLAAAKGNRTQNIAYCSKEGGEEHIIFGATAPGQGKRNDIVAFRDAIKEGATDAQLLDNETTLAPVLRYFNTLGKIRVAYSVSQAPVRYETRKIFIFWGAAGTGKTRLAGAILAFYGAEMPYTKDPSSKWWDNPHAHYEGILIDEMEGKIDVSQMKQLLDSANTSVQVEVKGGYIPINPQVVVLTSNINPYLWYVAMCAVSYKKIYSKHIRTPEQTQTHPHYLIGIRAMWGWNGVSAKQTAVTSSTR